MGRSFGRVIRSWNEGTGETDSSFCLGVAVLFFHRTMAGPEIESRSMNEDHAAVGNLRPHFSFPFLWRAFSIPIPESMAEQSNASSKKKSTYVANVYFLSFIVFHLKSSSGEQ